MPSATITSTSTNDIVLAKTPYAALGKMIPPVVNRVMSFELRDANCALANAIRRGLISEIPIKHLTVSLSDIKTSDPYVIGEAIRKRIEMIPISQTIDMESVFSVRFENNQDTHIDVPSSEIKLNGVTVSNDIVPFIPICDINSGTSFSVNDIHVIESFGFDNARVSIGRVAYEIIDHDHTIPSIMADPSSFRIVLETPGVIDPVAMVRKTIDGLIDRLGMIDYGQYVIEFGIYKLTIPNETHSIGRLLSYYIYKIEPTIKYVANRTPHPSQREVIVDVHHPNGEELCKKAAEAIKADLIAIRKTFA
jgi:DNA-directed RNA polymerase subunit L